jgi:hypothetical protein
VSGTIFAVLPASALLRAKCRFQAKSFGRLLRGSGHFPTAGRAPYGDGSSPTPPRFEFNCLLQQLFQVLDDLLEHGDHVPGIGLMRRELLIFLPTVARQRIPPQPVKSLLSIAIIADDGISFVPS